MDAEMSLKHNEIKRFKEKLSKKVQQIENFQEYILCRGEII